MRLIADIFTFDSWKIDQNQNVRLVIGAAGGSKITSAVAAAMLMNLWSEYNIKQAVDERRIHHQVSGRIGYPDVLAGSKERVQVKFGKSSFSVVIDNIFPMSRLNISTFV